MKALLAQETNVDDPLEALKAELEHFSEAYDAAMVEHSRRMFNITRDTSEFLAVLVHATVARRNHWTAIANR